MFLRKKSPRFWRLSALQVLAVFAFLAPSAAFAATLSVTPSSGTFRVGDSFSVSIAVASPAEAMNAAEGVLAFPKDLLQAVSVSKSGSIINLWAQEPSFSNSDGTVSFEGVALNPGFTGASGKILSVTFKVKSAGSAALSFSSGSVLANDGKGTNILTDLGRAELVLSSGAERPSVSPPSAPPPRGGYSGQPEIHSPTHPDQSKWYSAKDARFTWTVPKGVIAVATLLSRRPTAEPTVVYSPPINEKVVQNLDDGVVYFHLQFKDRNGWGPVAHFRVQVDTTPPNNFKVTFPHGQESEDPRPIVYFNTTDALSGISHYQIKVGDLDFLVIDPREVDSNPYTPPPQEPGKHMIVVKAIDAAGNETDAASEFTVLAITSPRFIDYPTKLVEGDLLRVRGITYPQAEVEVSVTDALGKSSVEKAKGNLSGDFTLVWTKKLSPGRYDIAARATDVRGSMSQWSEPLTITVAPKAIITIGSLVLNYLSLAVIIIALLGFAGFIGIYLWGKAKRTRRAIAGEFEDAKEKVHKAFDLLRQEVREELQHLEKAKTKRELTHEEQTLLKHLNQSLNDTERFIDKEIRDIEEKLP